MMKLQRTFFLFVIAVLPLGVNGQPVGKPIIKVLAESGGETIGKDIVKGTAAQVAKETGAAGLGMAVSADALQANVGVQILRSNMAKSATPLQVFQNDWKSIGAILEKQQNVGVLETPLTENEKGLINEIVDLSNAQLEVCRADLAARVNNLKMQQNRQMLLETEQSQQDFVKAVNDIVGLGLYGELKDVDMLTDLYMSVKDTKLGDLLLVPVTRAMVIMGSPEKARYLILDARDSEGREQLLSFWNKPPTLIERNPQFSLDLDLQRIRPALKDTSAEGLFAFDFSPKATLYWVDTGSKVRNSIKSAKYSPDYLAKSLSEVKLVKPVKPVQPSVNWGSALERVDFPEVRLHAHAQPMTAPTLAGAAPAQQAASVSPTPLSAAAKLQRKIKRYPSGLINERELVSRWASDFRNGYFKPRNQIETIEGMSAEKANNIVEYLYYMDLEQAEGAIIQPIMQTGRLPSFMHDNKLIPGTKRLPSMYYKNKFNDNVKRLVQLADGQGTLYSDTAELTDLLISMKDYNFKQGFAYTNSDELAGALRKKWETIVREVTKENTLADRALINSAWREPVELADGTKVSLRDYFTQTRPTAFFPQGAMPEFYLNSPKWVAWENVRRNLIAREILPTEPDSFINNVKKGFAGIDSNKYMTLQQFGELMRGPYLEVYRDLREFDVREGAVSTHQSTAAVAEDHIACLDEQIRQNNFDVVGGVCMSSFGDGGYLGNRDPNYDGTSLRARYEPKVFDNVKVVVFNDQTLQPEIRVINKVSYLKDLKKVDPYKEKASRMVGDGLDQTRDLLSVQSASAAILNIPSLRATIRPHNRISYAADVPYMFGGGLAGYLALFTPDFYPIKEVKLLRTVNGKKQWVTEYFIRREVVALSGFVSRERLTFSSQANLREQVGPKLSRKSDIRFGPQK